MKNIKTYLDFITESNENENNTPLISDKKSKEYINKIVYNDDKTNIIWNDDIERAKELISKLTEMEEYFSNIEYDFSIRKYMMNHTFEYKEDKYKIVMRSDVYSDEYAKNKNRWIPDLYADGGDLPLYRNAHDLYLKIFKINLENISLVQAISVFLDQKYKYSEIQDRLDEFDVIKDGKIDFISLENLFDFYDVKFEENNFLVCLKDRIIRQSIIINID